MLTDYVQKVARRILRLPKKPEPPPPTRDDSGDAGFHPLPEPQHTPPMPKVQPPRMPARATPSEDDL
jgi:hypothetical protein